MKLTDKACRNAKPKDKAYKMFDGAGLYLLIQPDGAKYWRLKYYFLGKEKLLPVGVFPLIGLADARDARNIAKKRLAAGRDPAQVKKEQRREAIQKHKNTFEAVAREWHSKTLDKWSEKHGENVMRRMKADVFPRIGHRPIADIEPPELLEVLRKIEGRKALDIAARVKQICGQVFRYGISTGKCKRDPSSDLKGALQARKAGHFAALAIGEMPDFLRDLEKNEARLFAQTRRGIKLLMLTFVRTSELIQSKWDEFDLDNAIWEIPAERMKMRRPHLVPLSRQAVAVLREQKEEMGHLKTEWVFPSQKRPLDPMSNNTILFAIGRMGYKKRMTGHGFRSVAMSAIKERLGYRHEVPDRQLAHAAGNKTDRAYDRAQFLEERIEMMQAWADYLDTLAKSQGKVVLADFSRRKAA